VTFRHIYLRRWLSPASRDDVSGALGVNAP
jgi:hypothetical protein